MGLLSPAEIRYTVISLTALVIMTAMLGFMGLSATGGYDPANPEITDGSGSVVNPSNPSTYSNWQPGSVLQGSYFGQVAELITDAIAYPFSAMNRWVTMLANAGWATIFIVIPSIVMMLVVLNAVYQIAKALPYT